MEFCMGIACDGGNTRKMFITRRTCSPELGTKSTMGSGPNLF